MIPLTESVGGIAKQRFENPRVMHPAQIGSDPDEGISRRDLPMISAILPDPNASSSMQRRGRL